MTTDPPAWVSAVVTKVSPAHSLPVNGRSLRVERHGAESRPFSSLPASPVHVGLAGELHIGSPLMAELSGRSARKIGKAAIHRSLSSWQSSTQKQLDEKE